jgi:hypothetical protein
MGYLPDLQSAKSCAAKINVPSVMLPAEVNTEVICGSAAAVSSTRTRRPVGVVATTGTVTAPANRVSPKSSVDVPGWRRYWSLGKPMGEHGEGGEGGEGGGGRSPKTSCRQ